jgi:apolipoprotein N-acyltransferase
MRSSFPRSALAVIATAIFTALAAPPIGFSPAALIALAPLIWAVTEARSWRTALLLGAAASAVTTVLVFHWVPGSVHAFFGLPSIASWALFPFYAVVAQPQLLIWAVARWRWRAHHRVGTFVASAALYAGLDWLLPKLFRDTLGVAFFADPWVIQVAELGGLYALTFAAVLAAEVACAVALRRRRVLVHAIVLRRRGAGPHRSHVEQVDEEVVRQRAGVMTGALWGAILIYGAVRSHQIKQATAAATVLTAGVVQANIGNVAKEIAAHGDVDGIMSTLRTYGELSDKLTTHLAPGVELPDVVIWPETAYPLAYGAHRSSLDDDVDQELATFVRERQVQLLFGGYQRVNGVEFNSALLLDPVGGLAVYHKFHLIPFGEYIPLFGRARFGTGGSARVLDLRLPGRTVRVGPIICYESLYPDHAAAAVEAGAQVLVNLTNDSWFLSTSEKELHLAMAAVRSVETRRAQVRATNTGISALVLPSGEIVQRGPIDEPAALRYRVPLLDTPPTLAVRFGAWTGPGSLGLCALMMVIGWAQRRRRSPASD